MPATPRRPTRAAAQKIGRRRFKRTNLTHDQRLAIFVAACRAAGSTQLTVPLARQVVSTAHKLLKQGKVWGAVPACGSWLNPKHAATVIRYWVGKAVSKGWVLTSLRKPRKLKYHISAAQLEACINEVTRKRCQSMSEAEQICESIQAVTHATGCSTLYLWGKMREYDPEFKARPLTFKRELTQEQKDARYEYAELHMGKRLSGRAWLALRLAGVKEPSYLDLVVFVDQKKLYVTPTGIIKAWGSPHSPSAVANDAVAVPDQRGKGGVTWCIYYYSAVNALTGALGIWMCTGCSGAGVETSPYKVRATVPGHM